MSDSYHGSNGEAVNRRANRRRARQKRVYEPLDIERLKEQLNPTPVVPQSRTQSFTDGYTGAAV